MTENKRFSVVMNEFDEVEYITDIVDCEDRDFADFIDFTNEIAKENEQLKKELQRIYDITAVNKVKNIVEEIYDDLLYETSEKSDYAREMVLKCLEKIDEFRDDFE